MISGSDEAYLSLDARGHLEIQLGLYNEFASWDLTKENMRNLRDWLNEHLRGVGSE